MKLETLQAEVALEAPVVPSLEGSAKVDAIKELADIELAYVGGGTASVIFA